MPEVGAGSTDLLLLTIMILRWIVVEKVCRVVCGTSYTQESRQVSTLVTFKAMKDHFASENLRSDLPVLRAANRWDNGR